ncbi:hypothetical protein ELH58_10330 [Rhizobium ruizarguesonis]|uniref:hypothetical protein n=1 Tax=Rhizobium TaxID=379 RepID=UPI00103096AE|nr:MULTISPECIES: hypothetical protein [Rhizobium]MBB4389941.1 hypothetical protein [Rhizobium leguminosarum]TBA68951.1 hypothetical protein ELH58_10330 [Rhizobium ruizarguesonis]
MTDHKDSLAYLRGALAKSTSGTIMLEMALADTHEERLALVERAVDWSVQELVKTRHAKQKMTEDGLSIEIVTFMKAMGFDAAHDTQYGGHCDIVVEAKGDFLWIAEAKIHKDYEWLLGGFEQLDRRYTTGLPGQDAGEMLIYCFGQRADLVLAEYQTRLEAARNDVNFDGTINGGLFRRSTHVHVGTGRDFRVRHTIVPLYFDPTK